MIVTDEVGSTGVSEEAPKDPAVDATYTVYECQWVADPTAADRLYQVPVIKAQDLDYGHYTAVILVSYVDFMNHTSAEGSYDFYLDSIRIYDSANDGEDNEVIRDAYLADGEGWPSYTELRNQIIEANTFDTLGKDDEISGIVFIDNVMDVNQNRVNTIADYKNFGPNNEVYIAPGQAIAFDLDITDWNADINGFDSSNIASVQLGIKTVGSSTRLKIYDAEAGADSAAQSLLSTATEMYYDMTKLNGKTVVIYNAGDEGDAILSVTNIKATFKSEPVPAATPQPAMLRMSRISTYRRMIGAKKGLPIVGNLPALADEERGKGWRLRKS